MFVKSLDGVDLLVLACDGVWDVASSESVGKHLWSHLKHKKQNALLTETIKEWMNENIAVDPEADRGKGTDNMSLIAVDCRYRTDQMSK